MPIRTQAVVVVEPGRIELRTVTIPDPLPNEVAVRTLVSGISVGTERHYITGAYDRMGERVDEFYPFVTGYQRCGVVEAVGPAVDSLVVGDRVIMGRSRLVDADLDAKGRAGHVGYGVLDARQVYRLAPETDAEEAALWVMAGVGLHGSRLTRIVRGETVAVVGMGMIGQMAAQAVRLLGARVVAQDRTAERVHIARQFSADAVFHGDVDSFVTDVCSTYPEGVDVVVDTGSRVDAWEQCLRLVRREGRVNLQGYYPGAFAIDSHRAHVHRVTAIFPSGYDDPSIIARVLDEKCLAIRGLITHRFPSSNAVAAYDLVMRAPREIVGAIIDWRDQ